MMMIKRKIQVSLSFLNFITYNKSSLETIVIIKKQEISREIGEANNSMLSPTTEKKIQYEKYVDNPDKYLKQK